MYCNRYFKCISYQYHYRLWFICPKIWAFINPNIVFPMVMLSFIFVMVFWVEVGCWDSINWFNPTTCVCLFQARTWISNVIYRGLFLVQWIKVIIHSIDIADIDDHHWLSFIFTIFAFNFLFFLISHSFIYLKRMFTQKNIILKASKVDVRWYVTVFII